MARKMREVQAACPTGDKWPAMPQAAADKPPASHLGKTQGAAGSAEPTEHDEETLSASPVAGNTKLNPTCSTAGAMYVCQEPCTEDLAGYSGAAWGGALTREGLPKAVSELYGPTCDAHRPEVDQQAAGREYRHHGDVRVATLR